ncbi:methyltransferase domain-containing protein [Candidatus Harpocratesius sp.]
MNLQRKFPPDEIKIQRSSSNQTENIKNFLISPEIDLYISLTCKDKDERSKLLQNLMKTPKEYFIRVNLTRISRNNLINHLSEAYPSYNFSLTSLENMISIQIKQAPEMEIHTPIIYCDKFAAESVMMGANLYVPGVCEIGGRFSNNILVSVMLDPQKLPKSIHYDEKHFHVANGITQIASKNYPKTISGIMVKTQQSKFSLPPYRQSEFYERGLISDQNFQANLATRIFAYFILEYYFKNKKIPVIFDTCSAPGHKTCALAEWIQYLTKKRGNPKWFPIISIDRSKNRLLHLKHDINRLGLENIEVIACKLEKIDKKHPQFVGTGDFVIFDPPCSALGPRPKLFIQKSKEDLEAYAMNQRRLLKIVHRLVKPGGYLMYNTCTFAIQENEGIMAYAINKLNYELVSLPPEFGSFGHSGLDYSGIPSETKSFMRRFYPTEEDGQGYFIALLKRKNFDT